MRVRARVRVRVRAASAPALGRRVGGATRQRRRCPSGGRLVRVRRVRVRVRVS